MSTKQYIWRVFWPCGFLTLWWGVVMLAWIFALKWIIRGTASRPDVLVGFVGGAIWCAILNRLMRAFTESAGELSKEIKDLDDVN